MAGEVEVCSPPLLICRLAEDGHCVLCHQSHPQNKTSHNNKIPLTCVFLTHFSPHLCSQAWERVFHGPRLCPFAYKGLLPSLPASATPHPAHSTALQRPQVTFWLLGLSGRVLFLITSLWHVALLITPFLKLSFLQLCDTNSYWLSSCIWKCLHWVAFTRNSSAYSEGCQVAWPKRIDWTRFKSWLSSSRDIWLWTNNITSLSLTCFFGKIGIMSVLQVVGKVSDNTCKAPTYQTYYPSMTLSFLITESIF